MDNDLIRAKKENLSKLRAKGVDPYPYKFNVTAYSSDLHSKFVSLKNEEFGPEFSVAGRVMAKRSFGAIAFFKVADSKGNLQFFMKKDLTPNSVFDLVDLIDVGDFVGGIGKVYRTQRGELSILVSSLEVLCKSILPLPEKFHGLQDIEIRQRKRYLDLIMNPEVRDTFVKRSKIVSAWREYMDKEGFLEVDTPTLQPNYGGASARPYVTISNAWKSTFYLSISPELYLKRLLVGGYEKVYTVCKNFRNEDVDKTHNPEFTMSEYYWAFAELNDIIGLTEKMVEFVALKVNDSTKVNYQGKEVDFKAPWKRIKMVDSLSAKLGKDVNKMSLEDLLKIASKEGVEIDADEEKWGLVVAELFDHFFEADLIQPTWVMEYPKETTPLCKPSRVDPKKLIERTELYALGAELGNGYSELNDPILQRQFFEEQKDQGKAKGENHPIDDDFLDAMGYGMPPAGGFGLGIDRLVMYLTNSATIKDVIFFPQMKPEREAQLKTPVKSKEAKMAVALVNTGDGMEKWMELNTVAHLNAAFGARIGTSLFTQDKIETKDGKEINLNIQHPIIIKSAGSSEELIGVSKEAKKLGLDVAEFTKDMIETNEDKKVIAWTKEKSINDIDFFGVLVFGNKSVVEKLTQKFKLYA